MTDTPTKAEATLPASTPTKIEATLPESANKNEKPKSKYYHFGTTDAEEAKKYVPQKIDPEEEKKLQGGGAGCSAWNSNGTTWENTDLTDWAKTAFKKHVGACSCCVNGETIKVSLVTMEGDASVVYSRGKPRIGFDVTLKCTYKGDVLSGELEVENLDETSWEDEEYTLSLTGSSKGEVKKAVREPLQACLEAFVQALKDESINPSSR